MDFFKNLSWKKVAVAVISTLIVMSTGAPQAAVEAVVGAIATTITSESTTK